MLNLQTLTDFEIGSIYNALCNDTGKENDLNIAGIIEHYPVLIKTIDDIIIAHENDSYDNGNHDGYESGYNDCHEKMENDE